MSKKEDDRLTAAYERFKKLHSYSSVRANHDEWWLLVLVQLAEAGKITQDEVFAIASDSRRSGDVQEGD